MEIALFRKLSCLIPFLLLTALMMRVESEPRDAAISPEPTSLIPSGSQAPTGTRAGVLAPLQNAGITVECAYRAETFSKLYGGLTSQKGIAYLGSIDTAFTFDLGKLKIGRGQLLISGQNMHGRSVNDRYVGAEQTPSNLDDAGFNRFMEGYYSDSYFNGRMRIKLGRQYADSDFNVTESSSDFLNASYGLIPTIPMPTYPTPAIGLCLSGDLGERLSAAAGVYKSGTLDESSADGKLSHVGLFTIAQSTFSVSHGVLFSGVYQLGSGSSHAAPITFCSRSVCGIASATTVSTERSSTLCFTKSSARSMAQRYSCASAGHRLTGMKLRLI